MRNLSNLKVTVVGGGGFLGTHLCNALASKGVRVIAFGRNALDLPVLDPSVVWVTGDMNNHELLAPHLLDTDVLYHLAATSTPKTAELDPAYDVSANVVSSLELFEAAAKSGISRIVFSSSGGTVYGDTSSVPISENVMAAPVFAYGLHKLTVEKYLALFERRYGLTGLILRVANPFGPLQHSRKGQGVVPAFIERALSSQPFEFWGGDTTVRDYVYVDDVADAFVASALYDGSHRIFNVGSGIGRSLADVANDIEAIIGQGPIARKYNPNQPSGVLANVLDCTRIATEMEWRPKTGWKEGLERTVAWYRTHHCSSAHHNHRV